MMAGDDRSTDARVDDGCCVVVVGASAGGVEALARLVAGLPKNLPAAVFVVLHVAASTPSALPEILSRSGALHAQHAVDGEPIIPGRIYVAPPGRHLLVDAAHVRVPLGPKENGHRPAIDPLFRSAAETWGEAAAGVILSGTLDDGAAGLAALGRAGGMTIVQADALFTSMVDSARSSTNPSADLPIDEIGPHLARWAQGACRPMEKDDSAISQLADGETRASPAPHTCPECGGALWYEGHKSTSEAAEIFRCRVGHRYSDESLLGADGGRVEAALWAALRALDEREDLLDRMARRIAVTRPVLADQCRKQANAIRGERETLRRAVLASIAAAGGGGLRPSSL